jgi:methionyl-tRNA synthetase
VWFDALTNYISTLGWPTEEGDFKKYWAEGTPTQYCGKDNLRFQSAMWQAMLMAAEVPNSHQIVINGFITADGGVKMSKSLGNGVDPKDIVAEYGTEALRFFLAKEISSFEDSPFTIERFKAAYNAHLANGLGNLTSRLMNMAAAYEVDLSAIGTSNTIIPKDKAFAELEAFNIQAATNTIWESVTATDQFIQMKEPFRLIKTDPEAAKKDIQQAVQQLFDIAHMLEPIMPQTSASVLSFIKAGKKPEAPLFLRKD